MSVWLAPTFLAAALAFSPTARAQSTLDHFVGDFADYAVDSGPLANPADSPARLLAVSVQKQGAAWLRLYFDAPELAPGVQLRITSPLDGESQTLDQDGLAAWSNSSAYFNGEAVVIEVFAPAHAQASRVRIARIAFESTTTPRGGPGYCGICNGDDRTLAAEPWSARLVPVGCSANLFCDSAAALLSAGHCVSDGFANVAEFNVPASAANCNIVHPPVSDQFPVLAGYQYQTNGIGADWAVIRVGNNDVGQSPFARYGVRKALASGASTVSNGATLIGYGLDTTCTRAQVQQRSRGNISAVGPTHYEFTSDVRGGLSGGAILNDSGDIIGIVTHCSSGGCPNYGTRIDQSLFSTARDAVAPMCVSCVADFNHDGGVDGRDVEAFFLSWQDSLAAADTDQNGGIDGGDVEFFFVRWQVGGC